MRNIFAKFQEYIKKPNRNVFDMTFRNSLTLKFGELVPVFCKEVIPGDSFEIDSKFGLQLMPMKFPIQTPIKGYLHFFYVRNRNTWKDWMDFIGGTKEGLVLPYVQPSDKKKFYRVGGLADYLGIPNVVYSGSSEGAGTALTFDLTRRVQMAGIASRVPVDAQNDYTSVIYDTFNIPSQWLNINDLNSGKFAYSRNDSYNFNSSSTLVNLSATSVYEGISRNIVGQYIRDYLVGWPTVQIQWQNQLNDILNYNNERATSEDDVTSYNVVPLCMFASLSFQDIFRSYNGSFFIDTNSSFIQFENKYGNVIALYVGADGIVKGSKLFTGSYVANGLFARLVCSGALIPSELENVDISEIQLYSIPLVDFISSEIDGDNDVFHYSTVNLIPSSVTYQISEGSAFQPVAIGYGNFSTTPFDEKVLLSALPFRAYEAIYNAYYRNPQNNPFIVNGQPEYNKYNTTYEGGSDSTDYDLYFRNWEYDFLTSAVQSPQQGIAPLVGMSVTGEATFQDEEGNNFYAQAILNENGEITGWQSHSSNMPVGSLRLLMDMAGTGISINDLRNVNAFQRFLENNIRHGLRYRDQIMSHFGVKVRYDELDMPEFIGGCSADVDIYKVSQTSNSGDTPLGSFVGQGQAVGQSKHKIRHYCDEHGFIIGILSVVPVPVYSQLLPKYFTKRSQLDYYFPEFGHVGYQPILQKEVSPLQTFYNGGDLNKVFGYQRAWYDYLASTDEVHGQFRTTMRDFLMNRTFADEPELGASFLTVDPDQLNDVFLAGTDDDLYAPEADKIIGSVLFNVTAKRPIPLFGIPKLEV